MPISRPVRFPGLYGEQIFKQLNSISFGQSIYLLAGFDAVSVLTHTPFGMKQ